MPNFSNFLGRDRLSNYLKRREQHLAALTWRRIQEKPSTIIIFRGDQILDPQIVRIENSNYGNTLRSFINGEVGKQDMHVLGIKNHSHLPDLNIQRGDIFIYDDKQFQVANVITTNLGWIQAYIDAISS